MHTDWAGGARKQGYFLQPCWKIDSFTQTVYKNVWIPKFVFWANLQNLGKSRYGSGALFCFVCTKEVEGVCFLHLLSVLCVCCLFCVVNKILLQMQLSHQESPKWSPGSLHVFSSPMDPTDSKVLSQMFSTPKTLFLVQQLTLSKHSFTTN